MEILNTLERQLCEPRMAARNKVDALAEIADILKRSKRLAEINREQIVEALLAREKMGSTGFGDGIAIPHCKIDGLTSFVVGIAISRRGVEFDAMDGKRAYIFCFIAGPSDRPREHVKLLAEISRALREDAAHRELRSSPTPLALYEAVLRRTTVHTDTTAAGRSKFLILTVQSEETLNSILEILLEMGIRGASVIPSEGMGKVLTQVPLFASFINFLGGEEEFHRTLLTVVPEQRLGDLIGAIEEVTGDLDKHTGVMALALDISMMKGSLQVM